MVVRTGWEIGFRGEAISRCRRAEVFDRVREKRNKEPVRVRRRSCSENRRGFSTYVFATKGVVQIEGRL